MAAVPAGPRGVGRGRDSQPGSWVSDLTLPLPSGVGRAVTSLCFMLLHVPPDPGHGPGARMGGASQLCLRTVTSPSLSFLSVKRGWS